MYKDQRYLSNAVPKIALMLLVFSANKLIDAVSVEMLVPKRCGRSRVERSRNMKASKTDYDSSDTKHEKYMTNKA